MKTKQIIKFTPKEYLKILDNLYNDKNIISFKLLNPIQNSNDIFNYSILYIEIHYKDKNINNMTEGGI